MLDDPKETLRLRRTLSLLNEILKEFSTIKLLGGVKVMSDVSGRLLDYFTIAKGSQIVEQLHMILSNYYSKMSATFSESSITPESIASQSMCDNISLSHLVYKCLVKMAVWFWGRIPRLTTDGFKPNQVWVGHTAVFHLPLIENAIGRGILPKFSCPTFDIGNPAEKTNSLDVAE
jgi:hypothetical protein